MTERVYGCSAQYVFYLSGAVTRVFKSVLMTGEIRVRFRLGGSTSPVRNREV